MKLQKYLELKLNEEETNNETIQKMKGKLVHFGEEICMVHYDSGYFIKGCPDISETSVIGTKMILSKKLDSRCYLKLFSRFKSKKLGDAVSLDDEVLIENSVEQ